MKPKSQNKLPSLMPREKLIKFGPEALKDYELLAILLRTGRFGKSVFDISKQILSKFSLAQLLETDYQTLINIKGIESAKACTILAAIELSRRCLTDFNLNIPIVRTPTEVLNQVHFIRPKKREYLLVMYLNARNQLLSLETISIGTISASLIHPREVFAPALELRAMSVILIHNHPSGNVSPSSQDIEVTQQIYQAGLILGIDLIDHIIVTQNQYCSLKEDGYF